MQYRTETQLRQELEDVWQMYHATKRGAQAAIEAAVAAKRERSNEIGRLAIRALCAWDESVLPKSNDGMMQERMEDLRAALAQQAERDALLAALKKDDSVTAPPIWETLAEIGESAPAGTWDVLPAQLTDKEARELWVLFQLRVALGDPTGELMQDELVERARNAWADAQLYRMQRAPLDDAQALALARQHLDKGLSWAPHIVRCTDLEVRALIRAVEAAHGIGA